KEGEDRGLATEVVKRIPKYLNRPTVLGIGEIGVNRITRNEIATFRDHVELALEHDQLILIHTPHLEDKYKGTKVIIDTLLHYPKLDPARVLVDHAEEHTIDMILSNGFYTGLTLYPQTKVSTQRAADIIEMYGPDRICIASACDWGPSLPTALPHFMLEMKRRKHPESLIDTVVYRNPIRFLQQCAKFLVCMEPQQAPVSSANAVHAR
ncbi:MAG: TatD family hydrolase, partial [Bryobacteraceae bacterium]